MYTKCLQLYENTFLKYILVLVEFLDGIFYVIFWTPFFFRTDYLLTDLSPRETFFATIVRSMYNNYENIKSF